MLSLTMGVVAGGKFEPEPGPLFDGKKELEPEPQLKLAAIAHTAEMYLTADFTASPLLMASGGRFLKLTGVLSGVNAALNAVTANMSRCCWKCEICEFRSQVLRVPLTPFAM